MGEIIAYPTQGQAMVNALVVVLGPGEKTVLHKHGVPTFIHVLEGEVKVARQRLRQFLAQVPDDDYALEVDRLVRELPASE
jgi:predicted metal-dependent enzyme (double-stranded beta helix superfamily)